MSPSMLFPHRERKKNLFTPTHHLPASTYAWLLPDNHLMQPCSLLPSSRKKPFLSARKETIAKSASEC